MKLKKPYHKNDITHKYSAIAFRKRMHQYLELPGHYHRRYPTEVVLRTMESGRMDELYSTKEGLLINLEEESGEVTEKTLEKLGKYKTFGSFIYGMPFLTAVICLKDPKSFPKEYEISPSDIIRPKYYYFSQSRLWKNYDKVINKVEQNIQLSEREALHIAFIPKYISKRHAESVTKSLARAFKHANIPDYELKRDIAFILLTMILSNVSNETEQDQLMEVIEMNIYRDDMQELVYSEYGDELDKKDQEIAAKEKDLAKKDKDLAAKEKDLAKKDKDLAAKDKELELIKNRYAEKIEEINAREDIPLETKKLINSILL